MICYIYIYINDIPFSIWRMEVSEKSVFPTSFGCDHFQENLVSFENESDLLIIYLTSLIGIAAVES